MFEGRYTNRRVLVTGHTGFKGSWLCGWLEQLGANVCGYSLGIPSEPSHWKLLALEMRSEFGDIRDMDRLWSVFQSFAPEMVFHMAAQPLVRASYEDPVETYSTNVMGTLNVFECCRKMDTVRAIVNVTSDKCYENKEWLWGYREHDAMGGHDPYSSSKGCAELLTASYRNSYFNPEHFGSKHQTLLASGRAGNVIGGGDWAADRLIPDIMRAVHAGESVDIRNPSATRPWQHVLEPLGGYLLLGEKLLNGEKECAGGWNFGPADDATITVGEVVQQVKKHWPKVDYRLAKTVDAPHEANLLKLDCSKAHATLGWKPVWDGRRTFEKTVGWYREFYEKGRLNTAQDLEDYIQEFQGGDGCNG